MKKFYEVQQQTGGHWTKVGYFKSEKAAKKYMKQFNTKTVISPLRIVEREFLG